MVPLKYISNIWRTVKMSLVNCKINLILIWSANCFVSNSATKLYVPLVTLSTQDNAKLLQQLKSECKRTINWNKYQ